MNKKDHLNLLKQINEELHPKIFVGFQTTEELLKYKEENIDLFKEYFNNRKLIDELEWELKTPQEKEEYLELQRRLREKYEGE